MNLHFRCIAAVGLTLALCGCSTIYVTEARLLRPPVRDVAATLGPGARSDSLRVQEHWITAPDGVKLYALVVEPASPAATVLYFGGNMFRISEMGGEAVRRLSPLGVRLILVDHRGYGRSTGSAPTLAQLESDAVAVYDYARNINGVDSATLVVHGHSIGSFLAGAVAENRSVAGVVLECSATTGADWIRAADRRPWYLRAVTRLKVEPQLASAGNLSVVQHLSTRLLVVAGDEDLITPPSLSRVLVAKADLPDSMKTLHVFEGADHNSVSAHPVFPQVYRAFLKAVAQDASRKSRTRIR